MSAARFSDFLAQDRRLALLKLLIEARGEAGESVLERGLKALGHRVGVDRDAVRNDLSMLAEVGCVVVDYFDDRIQIAAITKRGVACAEGRITVDGVAEPSMGR